MLALTTTILSNICPTIKEFYKTGNCTFNGQCGAGSTDLITMLNSLAVSSITNPEGTITTFSPHYDVEPMALLQYLKDGSYTAPAASHCAYGITDPCVLESTIKLSSLWEDKPGEVAYRNKPAMIEYKPTSAGGINFHFSLPNDPTFPKAYLDLAVNKGWLLRDTTLVQSGGTIVETSSPGCHTAVQDFVDFCWVGCLTQGIEAIRYCDAGGITNISFWRPYASPNPEGMSTSASLYWNIKDRQYDTPEIAASHTAKSIAGNPQFRGIPGLPSHDVFCSTGTCKVDNTSKAIMRAYQDTWMTIMQGVDTVTYLASFGL